MRTGLLILAAALLAACSGTVIGPDNQLEVSNATDNFQFQVSALTDVSQTLSYTWTNTGTQANVNRSSAVSGGTATLTIRDAAGTQVFTGDLGTNGTVATSAGTSGTWSLEVRLSSVSGTLNFRVQKP